MHIRIAAYRRMGHWRCKTKSCILFFIFSDPLYLVDDLNRLNCSSHYDFSLSLFLPHTSRADAIRQRQDLLSMFLTAEDADGKLVNPSDEVLRDGMLCFSFFDTCSFWISCECVGKPVLAQLPCVVQVVCLVWVYLTRHFYIFVAACSFVRCGHFKTNVSVAPTSSIFAFTVGTLSPPCPQLIYPHAEPSGDEFHDCWPRHDRQPAHVAAV